MSVMKVGLLAIPDPRGGFMDGWTRVSRGGNAWGARPWGCERSEDVDRGGGMVES